MAARYGGADALAEVRNGVANLADPWKAIDIAA